MSNEVSGLLAAGQRYQTAALNSANAQNPDYVRQEAVVKTTNGGTPEVMLSRCFDAITDEHLRHAITIEQGRLVMADMHNTLQAQIGSVGEESRNLSGRLHTFFQEMQNVGQATVQSAYFTQVISNAKDLTQELNRLSQWVQSIRTQADHEIGGGVQKVNELLKQYHHLNEEISVAQASHVDHFNAEDQRDALLRELSSYLPVTKLEVHRDHRAQTACHSLAGPNGISLLTHKQVHELHFRESSVVTPEMTHADGSLNGVEGGFSSDTPLSLSTGKLGGLLLLRDKILPQFQEMLDQSASRIQETLNPLHNQGTAFVTPSELVSSRPLDSTLDWRGRTGILRVALTDHLTGNVNELKDIDLGTTDSLLGLVAELNSMSGVSCRLNVQGHLKIAVAGDQQGIAFRGLDGDAQDVFNNLGLNDLFVGDPDVPGIAARIAVNPRLIQNPEQLSHGLLADQSGLLVGQSGIQSADCRNMNVLSRTQDQAWVFERAGELSSQNMGPVQYGALLLAEMARAASGSQNQLQTATGERQTWSNHLQETQGVNPERNEMEKMKAYEQSQIMMQLIADEWSLHALFLKMIGTH